MSQTALLEQRVKDLERRVATVSQERDELQKDVEALCLQSGGSMFSRSYVLTERVTATESELKDERAKVVALTAEKEKLVENVASLKIAKLASATLCAQQGSRLEGLEKELAHYQVQLSKSVSDRNQALFESEQLKGQAARAEEGMREARGRAEAEAAARAALEQQLSTALEKQKQQQQELEARTLECEEARKKVRQLAEERRRLDAASAALQAKFNSQQHELERIRIQMHEVHEAEGRQRVQLQEAVAAAAQLQGTTSGQAEMISQQRDELASLKAELAARSAEVERISAELAQAKESVLQLQKQLEQQRQELEEDVSAGQADARQLQQEVQQLQEQLHRQQLQQHSMRRLQGGALYPRSANGSARQGLRAPEQSDAEELHSAVVADLAAVDEEAGPEGLLLQHDTDGHLHMQLSDGGYKEGHSGVGEDQQEQMQILTHMVRDLKIKLAQATQEKVEALMKVAAARPESATLPATLTDNPATPTAGEGLLSGSPLATAGTWMAAFMNHRFAGAAMTAVTGYGRSDTPSRGEAAQARPGTSTLGPTSKPAGALSSQLRTAGDAPDSAQLHRGTDGEGFEGSRPVALVPAMAADVTLQAQVAAIKKIALLARQYSEQLNATGEVVWSHADAAKKWSAITSLSKIHEDLNRTRALLGLATGGPQQPGAAQAPQRSHVAKQGPGDGQPERELTREVLGLAEFGLKALEKFSRQEALSSVGMQY